MIFSSFKEVFSPFITAVALVYFLSPAVNFLTRRNVNSIVATLLVYCVIVIIVLFAFVFAAPKIYSAIFKIADILIEYFKGEEIKGLTNLFSGHVTGLYSTVVSVAKKTTTAFIGAVAAFYILSDEKRVKMAINEFVPLNLKPSLKVLLDDAKLCLDSFFKGQIVIALILFVIDSVFLYSVRIPYAFGLGFIAGVLDIVPYAGAFIAMGLILLVTAITSPGKIIIVLIGLLIIQQIENNIITPKISSDTLSLHPSVTVLVLYLGAYSGFWGILLAVPLSCIFKKICDRFIQSIV